jgi:sensor domain CHASE-containing protein
MTIRAKALLIIGVSLILMGGLIYAASRFTFMRGLQEIEVRQTNQNVERVLAALSYLITDLETDAAVWTTE